LQFSAEARSIFQKSAERRIIHMWDFDGVGVLNRVFDRGEARA
jgi:hypothetical protein